jgi:hypothetical protein
MSVDALWRSPRRQLLVLLGLTGFAISQPVLSVLGGEPAVLAFHGAEGRGQAILALTIAFVPPLVLWGLGRLTTLVTREGGGVLHLVTVAALVACVVIQLLKAAGLHQSVALVVASVGAGISFTVA